MAVAVATTMYHTKLNPQQLAKRDSQPLNTVKKLSQRRLHKAFLHWHDPDNWPLLRKALKQMGRRDLIGNGMKYRVPSRQPPKRHQIVKPQGGNFRTRHAGEHRGGGRRR